MVLPVCVADKVHVPAFSMVMVKVDTVHTGVVVDARDTVRPEDADGVSVNVFADHGRSLGAANVIVCDAWEITKLRDTVLAALK